MKQLEIINRCIYQICGIPMLLSSLRLSPALKLAMYDATRVLKETNACESISNIRKMIVRKDHRLKRTCRRCRQQITDRPILLIPLTQRTSTEGSLANIRIKRDVAREEKEHRDSTMHESSEEPDGRSER